MKMFLQLNCYSEIGGRPADQNKQFSWSCKESDFSWGIQFKSWPRYWLCYSTFLWSVLEKVQILYHITSLTVFSDITNAIHPIFVHTQQHPQFGPNTVLNLIMKKSLSKDNTAYIVQLSYHTWKRQLVVTHTITQNEISALLDSTNTKTHYVEM